MREVFHRELDAISDALAGMAQRVTAAMSGASRSLLDADLGLAERVIAGDADVDRIRDDLDVRTVDLLARQQPVAADLRLLIAAGRISVDLERMGDLARHVAKVARRRHPDPAVPAQFTATILHMSELAARMAGTCARVITTRDTWLAVELEGQDDGMDELHRHLYVQLLEHRHDTDPLPIHAVMDLTLCGRYYERYADHAVSAGRRVVYLVAGQGVPTSLGSQLPATGRRYPTGVRPQGSGRSRLSRG